MFRTKSYLIFILTIVAIITCLMMIACEEEEDKNQPLWTPTPTATATSTSEVPTTPTVTPTDWGQQTPTPTPGDPLTGTWIGIVYGTGQTENPTIRLELIRTTEAFTGTITTSDGLFTNTPIEMPQFIENNIGFLATANTGTIFSFTAILVQEVLNGEWRNTATQAKGYWNATRRR